VEKSGINRQDTVYEIGPGKGIITEQLARHARQVVAIEKDPRLVAPLRERFARIPGVAIHTGDFLEYPLPRQPYKVFANIPFNITSAIVNKLTTATQPPDEASLIMQKEAAEMLLGQPRESLRTILLKPWFEVEMVHTFKRSDFLPAPRVDVVMLRLRKRGPPLIKNGERQRFRDFTVHLFTTWQPRQPATLRSIFTRQQIDYVERALSIDIHTSPAALSPQEWLKLFAYFTRTGSEQAMQRIAGSERRLLQQQKHLQKRHRTRTPG
jgi:23S rRNA (adenine-N6)-dimethyltransferase